MFYVEIKKLPKDCIKSVYRYPFKFSGERLYVYQPVINVYGEKVYLRMSCDARSVLGYRLAKLI